MNQDNGVIKIIKVTGEAYTRGSDGSLRLVKPGDVLQEGDILVTGSGSFHLQGSSGKILEVLPNHSLTVDPKTSKASRSTVLGPCGPCICGRFS